MEFEQKMKIGGVAITLKTITEQIDKEIAGLQRQKAGLLDCIDTLESLTNKDTKHGN